MKSKFVLIFMLLFSTVLVFSQNDPTKSNGFFYKFSLATSFSTIEFFADECECEEDITELEDFGIIFLNNTFGYQFDKRSSLGLNFEYEWYPKQGLHFFPAYLSFKYIIIDFMPDEEDVTNLFIRGGYGTLLGISKDFEKGNMYKFGIGVASIFNKNHYSPVSIGLDFTRKRFGYRTLEGLSTFTVFVEFIFF